MKTVKTDKINYVFIQGKRKQGIVLPFEGLGSRSNNLFIWQMFTEFLLCSKEEEKKEHKEKKTIIKKTGGMK